METTTPPNSVNSIKGNSLPSKFKMDEVDGIDMDFVFKEQLHSQKPTDYERSETACFSYNGRELLAKNGTTNVCKNTDQVSRTESRLKN